ncbi:MAG: hypothetical protein PHE83_05710 [Opitutaceae bacterium]|nr:hypothetical protein [Opitutaceae bacterium]
MKYIIFTAGDGTPRCVLFGVPITHQAMADAHSPLGWRPHSAGFIEPLGLGKVRCFGRSESLNLGPAQFDESLIEVVMSATLRIAPQSVEAAR